MLEPAIDSPGTPGGGDPARYLLPVGDELDVVELPVEGEIPDGLHGSYVRNGPNQQFPVGGTALPYDGDGMLHVLTFQQAKVRYRNAWVVTKELQAERDAGRALFGGTFSSERVNPDGEVDAGKNWSNTNVVSHAGKILSLYERGAPYELSWRFVTVGEHTFDGMLTGGMTAHPKIDPVWDELCWFAYDTEPPYLTFGVVSPRGHISRTIPIDLPRPVLMHDFAATDQHVVFFDCPAVLDVAGATGGRPLVQWQPDHGTRVGVLTRDGESERVRWFPIGNRWVSHVLNAYTDADEVIVDYVHRPSFEFGRPLGVEPAPTLHRLVIDLGRSDVSDEEFDPMPVEFPRIDDRRVGLRHRYGFFAALTRGDGRPDGIGFDTLVRCDLRATSTVQHRFPEGVIVGEPQFVPRPESMVEGDGWILAFTYDVIHDRSELVVLDAEAFDSPPVATVRLPRRVPAGLHGTWLPGREPDAPRRRQHPV